MKKYRVVIGGEVEVEAENVAQAASVANKRLRLVGEVLGSARGHHERDSVRYSVKVIRFQIGRPRAGR